MKRNTKTNDTNNKVSTNKSEKIKPTFSKKINIVDNKKKASKKGKKNWRKNIDVTDIDKTDIKHLDENIAKTNIKLMKDDEIFSFDVKPAQSARNKFLGRKTDKVKKVKKLSRNEERKVKNMKKYLEQHPEPTILNNKPETNYYLWGDD